MSTATTKTPAPEPVTKDQLLTVLAELETAGLPKPKRISAWTAEELVKSSGFDLITKPGAVITVACYSDAAAWAAALGFGDPTTEVCLTGGTHTRRDSVRGGCGGWRVRVGTEMQFLPMPTRPIDGIPPRWRQLARHGVIL